MVLLDNLGNLKERINNLDTDYMLDQFERFKQRVPRKPPLAQATFCHRLWTEAFINDKGDVYPCCHKLPFKTGNIYDNTLEELWNMPRARGVRALSLARSLPCYDRCTLLDARELAITPTRKDKPISPYSRLRRIKILFGELCNIACIMCDQDHRSKRQLTVELLKKQVDFTHIEDIEFQGGEPLAMQECKRAYLWLTQEMGKKVNFLTNGTLISEAWAEHICQGSTWLYFSINGVEPETFERVNAGAKFRKVRRCIDRMQNARVKLGSDIELVGHFTMVPDNVREVDRFPELGAELGFDRVEFGYDIGSIPKWFKENPSEADRIRASFARIMENPPVPIRDHRLRSLGLV